MAMLLSVLLMIRALDATTIEVATLIVLINNDALDSIPFLRSSSAS